MEPRCDPDLDTLARISIPPIPYVDAYTGKVMAEVPMEEFGKNLHKVSVNSDSVSVTFRDGTAETGSIAIGCGGSHSMLREFLVGHEAAQLEPVDLTMINYPKGGYTAEQARLLQKLHPVLKLAAHPDKPGNGQLASTSSS
ncbi:MAG: hypothetical protein Q9166_007526 [cf. Caloplaca sp. 2 TL-2023]